MKTARIRLNAFHKDSSASYSKTVEVKSLARLRKAEKEFEQEVPFSRFYTEHECTGGNEKLGNLWVETLEIAMFHTRCPHCKVKDQLIVISFRSATGYLHLIEEPLTVDGFATDLDDDYIEKYGSDTYNERVKCLSCKNEFPLTEVTI